MAVSSKRKSQAKVLSEKPPLSLSRKSLPTGKPPRTASEIGTLIKGKRYLYSIEWDIENQQLKIETHLIKSAFQNVNLEDGSSVELDNGRLPDWCHFYESRAAAIEALKVNRQLNFLARELAKYRRIVMNRFDSEDIMRLRSDLFGINMTALRKQAKLEGIEK